MRKNVRYLLLLSIIMLVAVYGSTASAKAVDDDDKRGDDREAPTITLHLPNSTQGPFWPPAEFTDANGDFVLVGQVMTNVAPGVFVPIGNQAVIVSKNTVPALDKNGVEDPENWFGAAYTVVRKLDLSPGSADLNTVLYTNSFSLTSGGRPRIPALGDSPFNLVADFAPCKDGFPASSQKTDFRYPRFLLNEFPILGFQGDNVAFDPDTGRTFDPMTATGCGQRNCSGEDAVDHRSTKAITLGDWLKARGEVKITLTQFDRKLDAFTAARFEFSVHDLQPNSIYTIWAVRLRIVPAFGHRAISPLAIPNVIVTDARGEGRRTLEIPNPFPDPATDVRGLRVVAVLLAFHPDAQNWGACVTRLGPGVGSHAVFSTLADGTTDFTKFITKAKQ